MIIFEMKMLPMFFKVFRIINTLSKKISQTETFTTFQLTCKKCSCELNSELSSEFEFLSICKSLYLRFFSIWDITEILEKWRCNVFA